VKTLFAAPGPPAQRPEPPPAEEPVGGAPREVVDTVFQDGYYGVAYPAPGMDSRETVYAADVLVTLLEQTPWGRLPAALQSEATAVQANYQTLRQPGLLTITVQTSSDKLDTVEHTVQAEIAKLRTAPPSSAELEGTKRILTGMYAVENETFAGQAR